MGALKLAKLLGNGFKAIAIDVSGSRVKGAKYIYNNFKDNSKLSAAAARTLKAEAQKTVESRLVVGAAAGSIVGSTIGSIRNKKIEDNSFTVAGTKFYDKKGNVSKIRKGYKMVYGKLRRVRGN